ncbi:uncharacterized protein LOC110978296 [Acanthaster planci]|uniref:Uncharacterized protein LOC110978296 n=1 Tax=Acanthaster planci TaxID=133434 RepID=A0A8B7Y6P4_ACAPL|nr:uncharacterized protein LOC110978296 [Acanthaster planci]XP_022088884.1 uncharacterized protein LOC110978296 [Acanthaster planci]
MCSTRIGGVSVLPAVGSGVVKEGDHTLTRSPSDSGTKILKEGIVDKESHGIIYSWRSRFCILTQDSLTIFRSDPRRKGGGVAEEDKRRRASSISERAEKKNILYRLPLEEISSMSNIDKGRRHIHFTICTKQGVFALRVNLGQRDWLTQIQLAVADRRSRNDFMRELKTRTSVVANKYRKHNHRRLSFSKEEDYGDGIGITIRNEADSIVIARIFADGPAAKKGTLRPGDEIVEVDGKPVRGYNAERVAGLIKGMPGHVVLTVKPTWVDRGTNTSAADFALSRPLYPKPNNLRGRARPHSLADVAVSTDPEVPSATNVVNDVSSMSPIDRKKFTRCPVKNKNKETSENRLSLP